MATRVGRLATWLIRALSTDTDTRVIAFVWP